MNIVHIASHKGNIGDLINHQGFYSLFQNEKFKITKIELRDFYFSTPNRKLFNCDLADYINTFDLCIFGGGGFFDVQWPESESGTTLNLSSSFLEEITIPVLFNCMGYHEYGEAIDPIAYKKFELFLDRVIKKRNCLVTLRDDGSKQRLLNRFGNKYNSIESFPDPGFNCENFYNGYIFEQKYIGICMTNDLFDSGFNKELTTDFFNSEMSLFIKELLAKSEEIIFFPHTPADLKIISRLLAVLPEPEKRSQIIVAPYDSSSDFSIKQLEFYYLQCKVVIGMRFHSLINSINLDIPSIALCGHEQIKDLFDINGLSNYSIVLNYCDFKDDLSKLLNNLLIDPSKEKEKYCEIKTRNNNRFSDYRNKIFEMLKNL